MPAHGMGGPPPDGRYGNPYEAPYEPRYDQYDDYDDGIYPAPPDGPRRSRAMDYTLKGLGLLGVAIVSGVLWWAFRHHTAEPVQAAPPPAKVKGKYTFAPYQEPSTSSNCAAEAEKQVKSFLEQDQCVSMTRALYTTKLGNDTVFTSVIEVQMTSNAQAKQLETVAEGDGSGHIHDLVEDKTVTIPGGPHWLQDAGYESTVQGDDVYIATTEYQANTLDSAANLKRVDDTLKGVSSDALKQKLLKN
jgi:hypothetical protein